MKRIIALSIFIVITFTSISQVTSSSQSVTNVEHLTFMGIPIDGSLDQFVVELKKKGFALETITDSQAELTGKFAGEDASIFVSTTPKTHLVYVVGVFYMKKTIWSAIKTQYETMKSAFIEKYGKPLELVEKFERPGIDGSGLEFRELSAGRGDYKAIFKIKSPDGGITVQISSDGSSVGAFLSIIYFDQINLTLKDSEIYSDI